jgi:hypothetical protein
MSDGWTLIVHDPARGRDDVRAPTSPTKEGAFSLARARVRQFYEIIRIEGPNGEVIGKEEIMRWVKDHPEL